MSDPPADENIVSVHIPSAALAGEIEFAIAYTIACNPGRNFAAPPDRKLLAEAIVAMLYARGGRAVRNEDRKRRPAWREFINRRNLALAIARGRNGAGSVRPSAGEPSGP